MTRPKRQWGDHDRHLGPFTFAFRENWRPFAALISSSGGCHIRLQAFGATLICEVPAIVKPAQRWVDTRHYDWAHSDGYWQSYTTEYGFSLNEGHFYVALGAQTMDSSSTKSWSCFLPWTQWRSIAHRIFNADGSVNRDVESLDWVARMAILDEFPRLEFLIEDYDGEQIIAAVYAEEREWRLGTGWFRWLGHLRPRKICRSLDIRFNKELGPEKGSWKGGTLGHGIEMLRDETPEQAMRRYCDQEHRSKYRRFKIKFLKAAA